ncbi:hypothetical protein GCM10023206_13020 [Acinetobacter puyangensis]|uniref:Fe2+ or Zn2+ uptake regulation protein n=1 Tax=Acinetobacter puyangensis TaxID=1096779 RepID=A0A240E8Y5_9GAMM|nr:Fe2+ or Zn2+ uptake regulation protein [Acinetobacter puyangensis]
MVYGQEYTIIRDLLKHKNIKVTLPRIMIFQILKNSRKPITAYEIENILIKKNYRTNLATIYATLKILKNAGLLYYHKINSEQAQYSLASIHSPIQIMSAYGIIQTLDNEEIAQHIHQLCIKKQLTLKSYQITIRVD